MLPFPCRHRPSLVQPSSPVFSVTIFLASHCLEPSACFFSLFFVPCRCGPRVDPHRTPHVIPSAHLLLLRSIGAHRPSMPTLPNAYFVPSTYSFFPRRYSTILRCLYVVACCQSYLPAFFLNFFPSLKIDSSDALRAQLLLWTSPRPVCNSASPNSTVRL